MTGNPVGLVEFLQQRLIEREDAANWASTATGVNEQWRVLQRTKVLLGAATALEVSERAVAHVKLNDPAFVLQDIAAKWRIIEQYQAAEQAWSDFGGGGDGWPDAAGLRKIADALELTVRLLAAPFSSHPDWQPEWSVE